MTLKKAGIVPTSRVMQLIRVAGSRASNVRNTSNTAAKSFSTQCILWRRRESHSTDDTRDLTDE
jgi:hypothetical protein